MSFLYATLTSLFLICALIRPVASLDIKKNTPDKLENTSSARKNSRNFSQGWLDKTKSKISKFTFENGLTVVPYQIPESNEVFVGICYNAGAKDELPGEYGLAHAVEHMIFKGTNRMSETDLKAIAEKYYIGSIGQGYNAYTTADTTTYYFNSDRENWPTFLEIIADTMYNCRFDKDHFASEIKAIINEMKMGQANPYKIMYNSSVREFLSPSHPYHHPTIGDKKDLFNATEKELKNFYYRNYSPSRAVLVIAGDINPKNVSQIVKETLSKYKNDALFKKQETNNSIDFSKILNDHFAQKKLTYYKPVPNPILRYHWQLPLPSHPERAAFKLLNFTLNKRLDKIVRDEKDLVYDISAMYFDQHLCATFAITFRPKNKSNGNGQNLDFSLEGEIVETIKSLIKKELNDLQQNGPTATEINTFKKLYQSEILNNFESCSFVGKTILDKYFPDNNEYQIFDDLSHGQRVTNNAVKSIIKKYLRPKLKQLFKILPIPKDEADYWKELQEKIDNQDAAILEKKVRTTAVEPPKLVHQLPPPKLIEFTFDKPDSITTLSNGLKVHLKYKPATPSIYTQLSFKNSSDVSLFFKIAKKGYIQSFAMAMLHEGSKGFTKQQNRDFFHALGGSFAFSSFDGWFNSLPESFEKGADRFLQILKNPTFPEQILKQNVQSSIHQIIMSQKELYPTAFKKMQEYLFKDYPWVKNDEQKIEELNAVTLDQLFSFNQDYVNPSNMFLIVVGNYNKDTIKQQLEDTFGEWTDGKSTKKISPIEVLEIDNPTKEEFKHFLPKEQIVIAGGRVSTYRDTQDRTALRLLELYCNKKFFDIRERTGLFYSVHVSLSAAGYKTKGKCLLASQVTPANLEKAREEFISTLKEISENGIPETDLETAKHTYQMQVLKSFATSQGVMSNYDTIIGNNKKWTYFNDLLNRAQKITLDQINDVAKEYLNPNDWSFITVGRVN